VIIVIDKVSTKDVDLRISPSHNLIPLTHVTYPTIGLSRQETYCCMSETQLLTRLSIAKSSGPPVQIIASQRPYILMSDVSEGMRLATKRSKLQIYLDVLRIINEGTDKPTRIMYATNLSWKPLTKILDSLKDQGLIVTGNNGSHKRYETTERGRDVIKYLSKAMETVKIE